MKLSRLLLVFSLFILLLFSHRAIVYGLEPSLDVATAGVKRWATTPQDFQKIRDEVEGFSLEKLISATLLGTLYNLNEGISGKIGKEGKQLSPKDPAIKQNSGAIGIVSHYIAQITAQPPASSVEYIADLGHQINPVKSVYAQDSTGYIGLSGVLSLWKSFRNISYALFVVIFVVVGFMIMFRAKLNPQTVVSLQLALPKLIITLLLITFSYAISGFIIDLIYFTIYLAVNIFKAFDIGYKSGQEFLNTPFSSIIGGFKPNEITLSLSHSLKNLFPEGGAVQEAGESVIFSQPILRLIIGGAILFSVLKLLVQLVLAYINILLQVIFAPIILLFNALPQSNSFSSWIKNLLANAAAFPATAIMILVGSTLATQTNPNPTDNFSPPFLGSLVGINEFATNIIGIGTILLLPKIVSMIQEALKAKSALPAGPAIVEGIGAATALPTSFFRSRREAQLKRQEAQYQAQRTGEEVRKAIPS